jgi:hypothetical protein
MDRGLIAGALGFFAAFALERAFASVTKDIARYDAIRKMSDQQPLLREIVAAVTGAVSSNASRPAGVIAALTNDAVRYAKMRSM